MFLIELAASPSLRDNKTLFYSDLLENAKLEIQMLSDVNKSLKSYLIYGLKSEENLASLNSHFDQITNILIDDNPVNRNGIRLSSIGTCTVYLKLRI